MSVPSTADARLQRARETVASRYPERSPCHRAILQGYWDAGKLVKDALAAQDG